MFLRNPEERYAACFAVNENRGLPSGQGLQSFLVLHHRITGTNSSYREG